MVTNEMKTDRIKNTEDAAFAAVWEIYEYSFPRHEKRTLERQAEILKDERYHLEYYTDGGKLVGFIGYWEIDDYLYIEHYAMAREARGGGYGTAILKDFLDKAEGRTVILEIDLPEDDVSRRRLRFYRNLGFEENPYRHVCPVYQEEAPEAVLEILSWPERVDQAFYDRFDADLHKIVMGE